MEYLYIYGIILVLVLIIPLLSGIILTVVSKNTNVLLATHFGYGLPVYLGSIGVVIHELSHMIVAVLFRHKIVSVSLFKFRSWRDGTLGQVEHAYNPNSLFQKMGNFYIGLAPIYGCTAVLMGLFSLLFHTNLFKGEADVNFSFSWLVIPIILAIISIMIGGYDLSEADFAGVRKGVISFLLLLAVVSAIILGLSSIESLIDWAIPFLKIYGWVMLGALGLQVLFNLVIRVVIGIWR